MVTLGITLQSIRHQRRKNLNNNICSGRYTINSIKNNKNTAQARNNKEDSWIIKIISKIRFKIAKGIVEKSKISKINQNICTGSYNNCPVLICQKIVFIYLKTIYSKMAKIVLTASYFFALGDITQSKNVSSQKTTSKELKYTNCQLKNFSTKTKLRSNVHKNHWFPKSLSKAHK